MAKHRRLPIREVAYYAVSSRQGAYMIIGSLMVSLVVAAVAALVSPMASIMVVFVTGTVIVALRVLQTIVMILAGSTQPYERVPTIPEESLPKYMVLAPVYKEKANTIAALITNLSALDYPKEKLEILILVDESDEESLAVLSDIEVTFAMPSYMRVVEVADAIPGKPKALCAGFAEAHDAEIVSVFDAEDRPDADQLKKAAAAFMAQGHERVGCVQARLEFWDRTRTFVTHFMWSEYSVHFRRLLRGMQRLGLVIPLGGTSNHFRVEALRDIARRTLPAADYLPVRMQQTIGQHLAWDPFNMTEDADLGFALTQFGWKIIPIDSSTAEEAPLTVMAALKQRTRWHKGYLQTALVALRHPLDMVRLMGLWRYANFLVFVGGTPIAAAMFPFSIALTIGVAVDPGATLKRLFPDMLHAGLVVAASAAILLILLSIMECVSRRAYSSIFVMLLLPLWWLVLAGAALRALWEMRSHDTRISWSHTEHGVDLPPVASSDLLPVASHGIEGVVV